MELFAKLFSSTIGLLSIFTIVFIICMGVFYILWFKKKMDEDEQRSKAQSTSTTKAQD